MDDLDVEDILAEPKRKKGVNGGRKGKRSEREICKLFTKRFGEGFSRSVGSGNRWSQVAHLPKHARDTYSGDLVVPPKFKWCVENKGGYAKDIDLGAVFMHGNTKLDEFLEQAGNDSKRCSRKPILTWKQDRKPWLAFVHTQELKGHNFKYRLEYGKWSCVALECLLELSDEFFFDFE